MKTHRALIKECLEEAFPHNYSLMMNEGGKLIKISKGKKAIIKFEIDVDSFGYNCLAWSKFAALFTDRFDKNQIYSIFIEAC